MCFCGFEINKSLRHNSNIIFQQLLKSQTENIELKNKIKELTKYKVTVTYYVPNEGGINSFGDKTKTAVLQKPLPGKTVAVSRDLIHLLYKEIYVYNGKYGGVFYVNDLLADSYKGRPIRNQIDICTGNLKDIPKQGVFYNVPIAVKFN